MTSHSDFETVLKQARRCLRKQNYRKAVELFEQARELDATSPEACEGLATACFLAGDYENAASHFEELTKLDPQHARAGINLGAVYNRLEQYDKAVQALRKGIQKNRRSHEAYYNLGIAYRGLHQSSFAVSAYQEALRLNPQMAEAHQNLANVFVEMGNHQQAITHYRKALEIRPEFERAARGLEQAQQAVEAAKQSVSPFGRLVEAESGSGMHEHAIRELSERERFDDRRTVHRLAGDIAENAERLLTQIKREFEPRLVALNRAVAQSGTASHAHDVDTACDNFRTAVENYEALRKPLNEKVQALRSHEKALEGTESAQE